MGRLSAGIKSVSPKLLFCGLFAFWVLSLDGCNLPSDAKLLSKFKENRSGFGRLAIMSEQDSDLKTLSLRVPPPRDVTHTDSGLQEYKTLFRKLGLKDGFVRRDDFPTVVFSRAECEGSAIIHDCKGFAYSEKPLAPIQESLDAPPPKVAFKQLADNWYLFRDDG